MNKSAFIFWTSWLKILAYLLVGMGLFFGLFHQTDWFGRLLVEPMGQPFWGDQPPKGEVLRFIGFLYAVLGATLIGWGLMIVFLVRHALTQRKAWAWKALCWGGCFWYALDTGWSLFYGVWANVALNSLLLLAVWLPLLKLRPHCQD
ncbi:MAG: hypothetical protein A2527_09205 [Candidatus Lambdaproteobacteria bacterium RIFOXYD2_FULL_50_16]|uniref:Uncharacterized protein n=1 Tax=Candidatus Lambdaproteobacteria bacterium RIFOXYD2_FULL_50_16 TaxID=1817772 RepID=A0A1F6G7D1_9PROT|nr:MAG: hypothetical protein A2527_09205 [Candidatus Lambdaproteobacteria bacterium RIFOXYD2_FULL_50_16]